MAIISWRGSAEAFVAAAARWETLVDGEERRQNAGSNATEDEIPRTDRMTPERHETLIVEGGWVGSTTDGSHAPPNG
jgi:hypothetical protein